MNNIPPVLGNASGDPLVRATAAGIVGSGWLAAIGILVHGYWADPHYQTPDFLALFLGLVLSAALTLLGVHIGASQATNGVTIGATQANNAASRAIKDTSENGGTHAGTPTP